MHPRQTYSAIHPHKIIFPPETSGLTSVIITPTYLPNEAYPTLRHLPVLALVWQAVFDLEEAPGRCRATSAPDRSRARTGQAGEARCEGILCCADHFSVAAL